MPAAAAIKSLEEAPDETNAILHATSQTELLIPRPQEGHSVRIFHGEVRN
jgi:hypothetical protein